MRLALDGLPEEPGTRDGHRLAALRDTAAVDGPPSASLERLTRLGSRLIGVPVTLVTLVAERHQHFAAQTGLDEPWASAGQTPLSHSFCQHVVDTGRPLLVEDAGEHPLVAANLAVRDLAVTAYAGVPLRRSDGHVLGAFCAIDSSPRRWSEQELAVLDDLSAVAGDVIELEGLRATTRLRDPLTGLPDRDLFCELVAEALDDAGSGGGKPGAVLAVDLDGFRLVNEALGHAVGDRLLGAVARRLGGVVRAGDVLCRLAADQFLVFHRDLSRPADVAVLAHRLRQTVAAGPVCVDGHEQPFTASVGIAPVRPGDGADEVMAAARLALSRAKDPTAGEPGVPSRSTAGSRLRLRNALRGALERGETHVAYQPIVALADGRTVAVEALMRWTHPELGVVPPDRFIPVAESSGVIVALGEWILSRACEALAAHPRDPAGPSLTVHVNAAAVQLQTANFAERVAAITHAAGVAPEALTLEITEQTLLDDRVASLRTLRDLRALGVGIALDDFGTGWSSLAYLARFPVDALKIDRAFVSQLTHDRRSRALVEGIGVIASGLGISTVAEGIETAEQHELLRGLGCDLGQGYLFGRPAPGIAL